MRKHSSSRVENKPCADADSCCLVDRAVVTSVSQLWQTTEALRFLFASPVVCGEVFQAVHYTNCAKDVKMLRMALHKLASFWQGVITSQGAVTRLLLKRFVWLVIPHHAVQCTCIEHQMGICAS